MRVLVAQELTTAVAGRPCWGPMYGAQAVSEQALTEEMLQSVSAAEGLHRLVDGAHRFALLAAQTAEHVTVQLVALAQAHRFDERDGGLTLRLSHGARRRRRGGGTATRARVPP